MPAPSDDRKPNSWTARVLAPVFLVGVAAALVLVISGTLSDDSGSEESTSSAQTSESGCSPDADQAVKDGFYVVKEGDNFSIIAAKTCMTEADLQQLNPNLDPQALQPQNCVDLKPDGCKALAGG